MEQFLAANRQRCSPSLNKIKVINAILICNIRLCLKYKDPKQSSLSRINVPLVLIPIVTKIEIFQG